MGVSENKALVRRLYEEVWDRGNVDFAADVFADDYIRHDLRPTQALPGGAGMAKLAADFRSAFPDARWRIDLVFGEGDLVAARSTATGTFPGSGAPSHRLGGPRRSRASTSTGSAPAERSPSFGTIATTWDSWSRSVRRCTPALHRTVTKSAFGRHS